MMFYRGLVNWGNIVAYLLVLCSFQINICIVSRCLLGSPIESKSGAQGGGGEYH